MSHKWMDGSVGCSPIAITEPEIFKKVGFFAKAFLKLVTILGSARKGKSTLMNRIIEKDVFKTSDNIAGCTQGVHLYEVHETTADNSVVMYVDTEGQLSNDTKENDIKLFAPVVFLSKVIVFNVMGPISPEELLEKLNVFLEISERLNLDVGDDFKLGHLIITLRDYSLSATEDDVRIKFFGKEDDRGNSAQERNRIREKLRLLFESLEVFIFRKPVTEMPTDGNNSRVDEFKMKIHDRLGEPRKFGECTCLTPGNVSEFARHIVDHMNDPVECFHVKTLVESIQRNELDQMCEKYKTCLLKLFYQPRLPVDNFDEEQWIRKMNELVEQFKKLASKADFARGSEIAENLEGFLRQRLADMRQDNELLIKASSKVKRLFENELEQRFCRISLPDKPEKIEKELDQEIQRTFQIFEQVEDDLYKEQVSREELEEFACEQKEKRKKENKNRLYAREKIDKAKCAFKESMGKEVANPQFPKTADGVEECLKRQILPRLLKTFDKDTEDADLAERDYKNQVRNKLEVRAKEKISNTVARNKTTKAYEIGCTGVLFLIAFIGISTAVFSPTVENAIIKTVALAIFAAIIVIVFVIYRYCRKLVNFRN